MGLLYEASINRAALALPPHAPPGDQQMRYVIVENIYVLTERDGREYQSYTAFNMFLLI